MANAGGVELAEYLQALQAELDSVPTAADAGGPLFRFDDVSLTVTVIFARTKQGQSRIFVVQADDDAEATHRTAARLTLTVTRVRSELEAETVWGPAIDADEYAETAIEADEYAEAAIDADPYAEAREAPRSSGDGDW